jgi:putative ABC transport system permease protein
MPWGAIVGVAGNVDARLQDRRLKWQMYFPLVTRATAPASPPPPQPPGGPRRFLNRPLLVRAANPGLLPPDIKSRVWAVDRDAAIERIQLADDVYAQLFAPQRFVLLLMSVLAGIAIVFAAAGIFAVLSQAVARRTREIGIRVTLGAGPADIFCLIVSRGLLLTAAGVTAGTAGVVALSRVLRSLLYEVSPYDPLSFASVALLLVGVAFVACWLPARRALRVEAAVALRAE